MKTLKRGIVVLVLAVMVMVMSGFTYTYETEEPPEALIEYLTELRFERSKVDDDVWTFDGIMDGAVVHAYYDAWYNKGILYAYSIDTGERNITEFYWDFDGEDFDSDVWYDF